MTIARGGPIGPAFALAWFQNKFAVVVKQAAGSVQLVAARKLSRKAVV
jgi:hypothetical protein